MPPTLVIGPFRGVGDGDAYERDLRRLAGRGRVWVVISDVFEQDRAKMLRTLDKLGKRIYATAGTEGAKTGVYLYDLTR